MRASSIKLQIKNMQEQLAKSFELNSDNVCRIHALKEYGENEPHLIFSEELTEKNVSSRDSRLKFNCVYFNNAQSLAIYDYIEALENNLNGLTVQLKEINVKDDYIIFRIY